MNSVRFKLLNIIEVLNFDVLGSISAFEHASVGFGMWPHMINHMERNQTLPFKDKG